MAALSGLALMGLAGSTSTSSQSSSSAAAPSIVDNPRQATDQIVGVQTQVGGRGAEKDFSVARTAYALSSLGISSIRDSLAWSSFANTPAADQPRRNGPLLRLLSDVGGPVVLTLSKGDPRLLGGGLPLSPGQQSSFAAFIGQAYPMVESRRPMIEVWNEWNWGSATLPRQNGTADDYVALARTTATALRRQPDRPMILVGSAGEDSQSWNWTMAAIRKGMLQSGDGLAVHLYNQCLPPPQRTAEQMIGRLNDLHDKMRRAGVRDNYPVYITEAGWPTHKGPCGIDPQVAAANIVRLVVQLRLLPWVKGVWLYDLRDDGTRPNEQEDNFGLFTHDYQPKPAACALRTLLSLTKGASIRRIVRQGSSSVYEFAGGGKPPVAIGWDGDPAVVWYRLAGQQKTPMC